MQVMEAAKTLVLRRDRAPGGIEEGINGSYGKRGERGANVDMCEAVSKGRALARGAVHVRVRRNRAGAVAGEGVRAAAQLVIVAV